MHFNIRGNGVGGTEINNGFIVCVPLHVQCLQDIQRSEWLFPYEKLEFGEELGSGAFGVVRKAVILDVCDGSSKTVAVKTLKGM